MAKIEALLGKEEGAHRLEVRVGQKAFVFSSPESVPKSVSRTHCFLTVEYSDDVNRTVKSIVVKNVKMQNTTYVDGQEIEQKVVKESSKVQLGFERYPLDLPTIIAKLRSMLPEVKVEPKTYSIGRKLKTPPQQVDVPLSDYTGEKKMSRHHAKIEVVRQPNGNCKHVLYNWENKNPTRVDGKMVEFGDRIILHNGMVLSFANIDVDFVIEDSEETTT